MVTEEVKININDLEVILSRHFGHRVVITGAAVSSMPGGGFHHPKKIDMVPGCVCDLYVTGAFRHHMEIGMRKMRGDNG